jgi:glutamate/tyrosine decarboxylase-like PLP-dependent enzyme
MLGFPDSAEGLFVSGGSMANLTALTVCSAPAPTIQAVGNTLNPLAKKSANTPT